jgi:hypothetical protein
MAIKNTIAQISYFLKEDFHHVAPQFIQILLNDANLDVNISVKEQREGEVSTSLD